MATEEMDPHIFVAVLVHSQMYGAKGAPSNLLLDQVLVDTMLGGSVILAVAVLGPRVERFLQGLSAEKRVIEEGFEGNGPLHGGCGKERVCDAVGDCGMRGSTWLACELWSGVTAGGASVATTQGAGGDAHVLDRDGAGYVSMCGNVQRDVLRL
jgi:hypothetical protein